VLYCRTAICSWHATHRPTAPLCQSPLPTTAECASCVQPFPTAAVLCSKGRRWRGRWLSWRGKVVNLKDPSTMTTTTIGWQNVIIIIIIIYVQCRCRFLFSSTIGYNIIPWYYYKYMFALIKLCGFFKFFVLVYFLNIKKSTTTRLQHFHFPHAPI